MRCLCGYVINACLRSIVPCRKVLEIVGDGSWEPLNLHPCTHKKPTKYHMGMDQYLLIPFLGGWTSICQLFWCSPGVHGFDTLPYRVWTLKPRWRFSEDSVMLQWDLGPKADFSYQVLSLWTRFMSPQVSHRLTVKDQIKETETTQPKTRNKRSTHQSRWRFQSFWYPGFCGLTELTKLCLCFLRN